MAGLLSIALLVLAGCRCAHRPSPASRSTLTGAVGYEPLRDPNAPKAEVREHQELAAPNPCEENALPIYPAELLARKLPPQVVVVRIVVAQEGRIADAGPSPLVAPPSGEVGARLLEATLTAVREWCFSPLYRRTFVDGDDLDGDGKPDYEVMKSLEPLTSFLDLRFTFEVREGKGIVTSGTRSH